MSFNKNKIKIDFIIYKILNKITFLSNVYDPDKGLLLWLSILANSGDFYFLKLLIFYILEL